VVKSFEENAPDELAEAAEAGDEKTVMLLLRKSVD